MQRLSSRGNNSNIFGKARGSSKQQQKDPLQSLEDEATLKLKEEKMEREFERKCTQHIRQENWGDLDLAATEQLEQTAGRSFKGFFYLGVSLYKQSDFENCIRAFGKAESLNSEDA